MSMEFPNDAFPANAVPIRARLFSVETTSKKRTDAGDAVTELRKALGLTQQAFAWQLKVAITTIGRYESSNPPPRGEALLRFRDIARDHGLDELVSKFEFLHVEDLIKDQGSKLIYLPRSGETPGRGFLTVALSENALAPARICLDLLMRMNSGQKIPENIAKAYASLEQALRQGEDPVSTQIHQAMLSAVTGRPAPVAKKTRMPRKGNTIR
jgi:DNA-binding transcriptional regulator YiaG